MKISLGAGGAYYALLVGNTEKREEKGNIGDKTK